MATIQELFAYAPQEALDYFLLRCDEGLFLGACEWMRAEFEVPFESDLDYSSLRLRAKLAEKREADHPVKAIEQQRARETRAGVRDCWYCGECLSTERINCPVCGRNQKGEVA